jgi:hypothetical protein
MTEHILKNWRTTLVGLAQGANGIVMAVQALRAENEGTIFIEPKIWARFLLISAILKVVGGMFTKDVSKGSDRPQEIVDAKLENVPPRD